MDDQNNLMRQLLNQINLAKNLGLQQQGKERRMDEPADRQFHWNPTDRVGVSRQGDGQQRNQLTNMTNVRDRLGPRPDIHAHLGPQGNVHERLGSRGGQTDNHRNEDREERRSAACSQRNIHNRLGLQGGQLDNLHNKDNEEMRSAARSRRTNSRRQVTENLSQAQSLNTPPRQRNQESRSLQTK
ncbi:unnamed protein product [Prunus armeniaca]